MSFFEGLKKIVQGKPVFEPTIQSSASSEQAPDQRSSGPIKVYITETESRLNGSRMEVYSYIKNESAEDVFLDKIRLLGSARELDSNLRAGDNKQFVVYSGEPAQHTHDNDTELQYRTLSGVYYKARHDVRFKPQDDYYLVEKLPYENTSQI